MLNKANIAQVSPANTNPTLTQGADFATNKKRPFPNYFRVSTTDAIQGPFGAQFMFKNLKLTNVATIHDQKTYGKGLVDEFSKEFLKRGGKIVATEVVNPDDKDFSPSSPRSRPPTRRPCTTAASTPLPRCSPPR